MSADITPNRHTAASIARAAGMSKRGVLSALAGIKPSGVAIVGGNEAAAWEFSQLPECIRARIQAHAEKHFACPADASMLESFTARAPEIWQPACPYTNRRIPLAEIADAELDKAATLRRALSRALELRNRPDVSAARLEEIAQEDYRREFGHTVTTRSIRALIKRTVDRDGFLENWNRLEIYLAGNPKRKGKTLADDAVKGAEMFAALHDVMAGFKSTVEPSPREKEALWTAAVELWDTQARAGFSDKYVRVRLVNYLWTAAPWLSCSKNALRVSLAGKYRRWIAKGRHTAALRDGRHDKKGETIAAPLSAKLLDAVTSAALFKSGNRVSQAARETLERANAIGLDENDLKILTPDSNNKSYVNHRLRRAVTPEVSAIAPYILGKRALDTARASVECDYSDAPSGFCYSADDVTLPVYWYEPDGNGGFNLVRGQCIITIDERTLCILGFSLQPDRNYSSPVIHTNFTRVFSDFGVPRKLKIEGGIWRNAKLITGGARADRRHPDRDFMPFSWEETKRGFADFGVEFIYTTRAKSKNVERVIGLVQDLMEGEPGYCGRDERRDCPAHTKQQMDDVKAARVHPEKYFYNFNQWEARLLEICNRYNSTPQQGRLLAGMSPIEAQEKLQSGDPEKRPLFFDHTCRYLLAHYRIKKEIGRDGFVFQLGKKYTYRSPELSRHKFTAMLGWFDPDEPSMLTVTDMNMKRPFTVPLCIGPRPFGTDEEGLSLALEGVAGYEAYHKARYQVLKANFAIKFRTPVPSRAVIETGVAIRQEREVANEQKRKISLRRANTNRRAGELGIPAAIVNHGEMADEGTRLMLEAKRSHERKEATTQEKP